MDKKVNGVWEIEETEIGRIDRKIKESISRIVAGSPGAIDEAISLARERERILFSRIARK